MSDQDRQDLDGLVFACVLDGQGGARDLDWAGITAWTHDQGVLWVHLDVESDKSRDWIQGEPGLGELVAEAITAEETRPRSVPMRGGLLMILRGITHIPGPEPNEMVSLRMWLSGERIITARRWRLSAVDDVHAALQKGIGPRTSAEFLVTIAEHMAESVNPAIDELEDTIDVVETYIPEAKDSELVNELAAVRRQAIQMRRHMGPLRDAFSHLLAERIAWLGETERALLREVREQISHHIEDLDASRERAQIAQDQLASKSRHQSQRAMYILAVVTAMFLPLSFIAGLLGMNVGGVPGEGNPFGFAGSLAAMGMVMAIEFWLFRRIGLIP